ncbi:MAG: DUF4266 domain-containing protein [Gammaproteobacteria bacterium]|nr:DUF4266 domain-containing protein [Gammaproteobacteria bacterium]
MKYQLIKFVFVLLVFTNTTGCSHVEPWERGRLAKPHMSLDPEPTLTSLRDHVQVSKEATSGGSGTSGGGCGCN